ncbi:hypothetical protein EDD85DRAFT_959752 [Armillaria nabsnona]|nr:hypothetical protein EDD85DRAFT_959752 [Armillaria nabsnona]
MHLQPTLSFLPHLSVTEVRDIIVTVRRVIKCRRARGSIVLGLYDMYHFFELVKFTCLINIQVLYLFSEDSILRRAWSYLCLALLVSFGFILYEIDLSYNRKMSKIPMRQRVFRNMRNKLGILRLAFHSLSFQNTMNYCRYVVNILKDGLSCDLHWQDIGNEDLPDLQSCNDNPQDIRNDYLQVTQSRNDNPQDTMNDDLQVMQLSNDNLPSSSGTLSIVNCRFVVDRSHAQLALDAGLAKHNMSRDHACRVFRSHQPLNLCNHNNDRFKMMRGFLTQRGTITNIPQGLLRPLTAKTGIIQDIREDGNKAAHCVGTKEEELQASINRQDDHRRRFLEKCLVYGAKNFKNSP